ncbi:ATP-binding cassette domain-containing protein [bacterium]|nr:ATP-binding cassette domain-containing protein [bacterium]MBU4602826.1 ATP-binding cassette domain-containing protein [bacterium]MCG2761853.1 ATP-binding cassette domain-containing protein [Candidatus Atribacteria bacterium]MCG2820402.1 ATP-binding cassette domain-containing protein [Candidatus Atribacteria bacterium]
MIQVEGLTKIFHDKKRGKIVAVNNLQFNCQKGQVFGLLGPNGAGKTTTLRILATMILPTKGEIMVNGLDIVKHAAKVRRQIGFLSSETGLYDRFTPRETILFFGRINGMEDKIIEKRMAEIFQNLDMEDFQDVRVNKLSTGMKQKLSIARSIIHNPPVLILDEPTVGLDIITAKTVIEYVKSFRDQGKCIIYSTHIMREAEKLCDRIAIIHQGNLIAQGTLEELKKNSLFDDLEEIFFELINQGENQE